MTTPKWKIKFTRQAVVERAPRDPKKGGYEKDVIAAGTEIEVNAASLNFWQARGGIEVLGRVEAERLSSAPTPPKSQAPLPPFGLQPQQSSSETVKPLTKTALKPVLEAALAALTAGKNDEFVGHLKVLDPDLIQDPLVDLPQDPHTVLFAAIEDARATGAVAGNLQEVHEALLDAVDILLPPSRRTRTHAAPR